MDGAQPQFATPPGESQSRGVAAGDEAGPGMTQREYHCISNTGIVRAPRSHDPRYTDCTLPSTTHAHTTAKTAATAKEYITT